MFDSSSDDDESECDSFEYGGEDYCPEYSEGYWDGEEDPEPLNNFHDREMEYRPFGKIFEERDESIEYKLNTPYAENIIKTVSKNA